MRTSIRYLEEIADARGDADRHTTNIENAAKFRAILRKLEDEIEGRSNESVRSACQLKVE
jgi:hypothetical protein